MPSATNQTVEQALETSIKRARQLALSTDYKSALVFYQGLDEELAQHIGSLIEQGDAQRAELWSRLRDVVAAERQSVQDIVAELAAFANPAAAVRLDRNNNNNNGNGGAAQRQPRGGEQQQHGANPYSVPRAGAGGPRAPYRTDDDDGQPYDLPAHREERAPPPRYRDERPALRSGDVNERLYGDRDKFAPDPAGPAPTVGFGVPPPIPKRNNAGAREPRRAGAGAAPDNGGANSGDRPAREKRKPGLPKFGGAGAAGGGGGGAGAAGGGKTGVKGAKKDGEAGGKKRAPFVPRPGDEEHAEAIASDMTDPSSINVTFADIAGQEEAKQALEEAVVYPTKFPDFFVGVLRPAKGVLLYGPPGTGKSMLAKAVASMGETTFFNVSPATLVSKMRGDSEKLLRVLFDMARHYSPSVIFIDEIDSLCGQRGSDQHEASRRALSVLLTMIDGVGVNDSNYVLLLGATNHPWDIDEAMRRRLEKRIYIPLPEHSERVALLRIVAEKQPNVKLADDVDFELLSREVERQLYSGADLAQLAREAFQMSMRRYLAEHRDEMFKNRGDGAPAPKPELLVTLEDFRNAISKTPSSIDPALLKRFGEWQQKFTAEK
eukprot:CAMPEP_0174830446 /NCGR_PEP_ID=MMETSP1114-20130205/2520_1 /TAXON_ID=312471 /ORGANISM="Neobodo designis, Strain CCAP 1951/1" /LENGTH=604 /DNA_ID=CAMNT_0016064245 /DNA_START=77 /DNA_END=1891 /DNA_ORIENTATION=-